MVKTAVDAVLFAVLWFAALCVMTIAPSLPVLAFLATPFVAWPLWWLWRKFAPR